jgi:hypothetical protein
VTDGTLPQRGGELVLRRVFVFHGIKLTAMFGGDGLLTLKSKTTLAIYNQLSAVVLAGCCNARQCCVFRPANIASGKHAAFLSALYFAVANL